MTETTKFVLIANTIYIEKKELHTSPKACKNSTIMRTSEKASSLTPQFSNLGSSGSALLSVNSRSSRGFLTTDHTCISRSRCSRRTCSSRAILASRDSSCCTRSAYCSCSSNASFSFLSSKEWLYCACSCISCFCNSRS